MSKRAVSIAVSSKRISKRERDRERVERDSFFINAQEEPLEWFNDEMLVTQD